MTARIAAASALSSNIAPRSTLERLQERTKLPEGHTEGLGHIEDPVTFFEADKRAIFKAVGDLSDIRLPLNRILIAIFVRGEKVGSIIIPDKVRDEDVYQGVAGLVIKMGPHCYEANDSVEYVPEDKCQVGDWVMFRRGEGFRTRIRGRDCIIMESERGVKMVLPRPDLVY